MNNLIHAIKQNDSKYNITTYGTQCKQCCLTELQMQLHAYGKKTKYILNKFTGRNFHKSVVLYQNINIYTYYHDLHVINIIVTVVLISAGKQDFLLCHQWPRSELRLHKEPASSELNQFGCQSVRTLTFMRQQSDS